MRLNPKLTRIRDRVLLRKEPWTTLHWSFLKRAAEPHIQLHRYVFLHGMKKYSVWVRIGLYSYNYFSYWLFFAPMSCVIEWRKYQKVIKQRYEVTALTQMLKMLFAAYAYAIPPREFYRHRLFLVSSEKWLKNSYDFQNFFWHNAFLPLDADDQLESLSDKRRFELEGKRTGWKVVESLLSVDRLETLSESAIKALPHRFFIKPTKAHRARGAAIVERTKDNGFVAHWLPSFRSQKLSHLQPILESQPYLVQTLLRNSFEVESLLKVETLAVIRLVSILRGKQIEPLFAILETTSEKYPHRFYSISLNIESGVIESPSNPILTDNANYMRWVEPLVGKTFPHWQEMREECIKAHSKLPQMASVGWDVASTNEGVKIIEGNSHWSFYHYEAIRQYSNLAERMANYLP